MVNDAYEALEDAFRAADQGLREMQAERDEWKARAEKAEARDRARRYPADRASRLWVPHFATCARRPHLETR